MSEAQTEKNFGIQKVYTKNISFESPNAPAIFLEEFQPVLNVDLSVESKHLDDDLYHVEIRVTVTTTVEDTTAFLCEVEQAGIFNIVGFEEEEKQYILAAQCPNVLFPYAREVMSDLIAKGGFPQLLLEPVNFDAMYAEHVQENTDSKPS